MGGISASPTVLSLISPCDPSGFWIGRFQILSQHIIHIWHYQNRSSCTLISSRLDYCNSLINNIAKQDLSKLKRVQNCLARVILRAPRFSPSLPLLTQLHWLPVNYRIKFKLCTLTFRALAIHQPPNLASLLHFSNIPRQLRSSTSQQLSIPRTKLNLGKRAFSVAAPIIWNELPTTLKSCESLASFRKNLKTYLYKIAFPP